VFPLAGKTFPKSADELEAAIRDALADVLTLPKPQSAVAVDAPKYPDVKKLTVNLDGASVGATEPPPKPKPAGKRELGVRVARLDVSGHPIKYENSTLDMSLTAKDVTFEFARDKKGNPLAVLADAAEGSVEAKISKADIKAIAMSAGGAAAKQQGVTLQDVDIDLKSQGPRSVAAEVRVKAKKMVMSGVLRVRGKLDVDDELNATVSDLSCEGEGVIGTMAAGVVQGYLKRYNGKEISLLAFSLGDVTLRDLKIDAKDGLHVTAKFGKAD
jgi:hypothetical protein